ALFELARLQRKAGESAVDVAQDRLRLVKRETVMLEGRHAPERMAREVLGLFRFRPADRDELVGCTFLLEADQNGAQERAAGDAIDLHAHRSTPLPGQMPQEDRTIRRANRSPAWRLQPSRPSARDDDARARRACRRRRE